MNVWYIALVLSSAGLFSNNLRVKGWCGWIVALSVWNIVVAWGLI